MAAPIRVSTAKYTKTGQVEIDGQLWTVKLPGAGTELRMAQLERESKVCEARIKNLEAKIDQGVASDDDIDRYEELCNKSLEIQKESMSIFQSVFNDGTEENESVKQWLNETPTAIQYLVFEDVKNSGEKQNDQEARPQSPVAS